MDTLLTGRVGEHVLSIEGPYDVRSSCRVSTGVAEGQRGVCVSAFMLAVCAGAKSEMALHTVRILPSIKSTLTLCILTHH